MYRILTEPTKVQRERLEQVLVSTLGWPVGHLLAKFACEDSICETVDVSLRLGYALNHVSHLATSGKTVGDALRAAGLSRYVVSSRLPAGSVRPARRRGNAQPLSWDIDGPEPVIQDVGRRALVRVLLRPTEHDWRELTGLLVEQIGSTQGRRLSKVGWDMVLETARVSLWLGYALARVNLLCDREELLRRTIREAGLQDYRPSALL